MKGLLRPLLCAIALLLLPPGTARAADPAPANPLADQVPFFAAALSELISDTRSFTARADLWVQGATAAETIQFPFAVAMHDGSMRWQTDLAQMRGQDVDTDVISSLKQLGLTSFSLILRPHTNAIVSFPTTKSYVEMPLNQTEPLRDKAQDKVGFLQKTYIGKETINGHPCLKYKLTCTDGSKRFEEAYVWKATDLNDLAIRLVVRQEGKTYTLQFSSIQQKQPDKRLFEPPTGYARYQGMEGFLAATALKNLSDSQSLGKLLESLR